MSRLATMEMTERQERRLWRHVESIDGFWETLKEIEPGTVARLAALASDRRWELIFLTKRPESAGATAQVQTQRWLQAHGFSLPSVFVVQGSRGRVADAFNLDFVVDDRPENCLDVVIDSTTRALLVWREDERCCRRPSSGPECRSSPRWLNAWQILEQMDRPTTGQSGLIGWLKRRFRHRPRPTLTARGEFAIEDPATRPGRPLRSRKPAPQSASHRNARASSSWAGCSRYAARPVTSSKSMATK